MLFLKKVKLHVLKSRLKIYIVYVSTVAMLKALLFLDNKEKKANVMSRLGKKKNRF